MTLTYIPLSKKAHALVEQLEAEINRLGRGQAAAVNWLRRQANAEQEPKARAAFVEAHNAVRSIFESRKADEQNVVERKS